MAGFDSRAYEDQVLKPLRRRLPHLPDDLLTRYAVELAMDPAALRERVASVVRLWNKAALQAGPTGLVCQQLLREHAELERTADLSNPQWWQSWVRTRHRRLDSDIAELSALLSASHGELGVITHHQLRAAAAAHPTLGDAEIEAAGRTAGLRIVEPLTLPTEPGMTGRFESLQTKLLAAGIDSIPRLLFPELSTFGLLGGSLEISQHAVEQRAAQLDTLPDSPATRAQREAVGILISEAKGGADLTALALFHLLADVRDKHAEGAQPRTLHTLLTHRGLRSADAGRIVVSVLAEFTESQSAQLSAGRDPLAAVTNLLAGGKLVAAHQLATTLTGPAGEPARAAVARQGEQVAGLRRDAGEELRAGHDARARTLLREALRLATDLPELAVELARVPAAPVTTVTANPDGTGVRIAWRPAPDHDKATTFRVIRQQGREPADVEDGHEISVRGTGYAATGCASTDEAPPVGRAVHYAVFACTPGGQWSAPVGAGTRVIPPVTDVVIEGRRDAITARWRIHPDVAAVEVRRTASVPEGRGEPVTVDRNQGFCDQTAVDGVQYFYTLIACYPRPDGAGALRSAAVVVRGATRPEAKPVTELSATPAAGAGLAVRLRWSQRPGSEIVIRRSGQPCPWEYGQLVALAELAGYGTELAGARTTNGESMTLVASLPPGRSYCVPFSLDGTGSAVRGQDTVVELADPVRRLRAQRFGDDVRVSWQWPEAVSAADVQWTGGRRRITLAQYRDEGGCRLRGVPGVARVEVAAVLLSESGECRSSTASVLVEQRLPQLGYQLRRSGHRLTGGVKCVVTISAVDAGQPGYGLEDVTIIIVAAAGHVMPSSPEAGMELLRQRVVIDPATPVVLEAALPRMPRPYWLRCFLADGAPVQLTDPPVGQLKVC